MNGVHDMGGMHGFGPVERETNEPTFHAAWEGRVWAMVQEIRRQGYYTIDASRYGIERLPPADYLRSSYYERWLASLEFNLIHEDLVTGDEVDAKVEELRRDHGPPRRRDTGTVTPPSPRQHPPSPPPPAPRFAVGDAVVARNDHPVGHTRLPRYARGKRGAIDRCYGPQIFPDANAHDLGEQPQPLYCVRFAARELWGDAAEPLGVVYLDLWDSYLDPAAP